MINILHYGLSTNRGGIETYLHKLYSNIDKSKFKFSFINFYGEEVCFYNEFRGLGATFYDVVSRKKSIFKNKKSLDQLFANNNFDIFHCHLNTLSDVGPILAALNTNCKVIIHSRSSYATDKIITRTLHKLNSIILPNKEITKLAVSEKAGQWLFGKNSSFTVINNGVDTSIFRFNPKMRKEIRKNLELEDKFVIGHVGAFLPVKNHSFIIDVFMELKKIKVNSKLLLIGDGYLKQEIIDKIDNLGLSKDVEFLGRRENVNDFLSAMDYFVFPSIFEGFGNAIVEAQATGLPCLVSDSISDEAVVLETCRKMSWNLSPREWAQFIKETDKAGQRNLDYRKIINAGLSVEEEINKIEGIYNDLMK